MRFARATVAGPPGANRPATLFISKKGIQLVFLEVRSRASGEAWKAANNMVAFSVADLSMGWKKRSVRKPMVFQLAVGSQIVEQLSISPQQNGSLLLQARN